ncbi:MAG: hypothetical protein EPO21_10680 [Chloroflexota bacterium]|nr:MAG: hypothetical protein EPO21_10680 [Chloroflexota bacterium]
MTLHYERFPKLWILGAILASVAVLILAGCGASSAEPPSTASAPARASVPTADAESDGDAVNGGGLKRTSQGGNVTVEVTWDKASASSGNSLRFTAVMDTHSVDLDSIDLSKQAVLRNESGTEVAPQSWDAPKGGHHRSGTLVFPATVNGNPLIGPQTTYIEVIVRDVAGIKERSFKWETGS